MVDQRVGRAGGKRPCAQAAARRLDEGRLAAAQVAGEPDHSRGAEAAAEVLTEPLELVLAQAHDVPDLPSP